MGKFVIYNGGTEAFYHTSNPSVLVKGDRYEVVEEIQSSFYTNYTLKGIQGEFNSVWFDEVKEKKVYLAKTLVYTADIKSLIGRRLHVRRVKDDDTVESVTTALIVNIEHVYGDIYKLETENTVYVTEVNKGIES